jgi:histidinol-phosphate aminotransferase
MSKSPNDHVKAGVREIDPYKPGKPIEEVEREMNIRAVKLASNENPLGPSPLAVEAVKQALAEGHRYPDGGAYILRQKLAARLDVDMERIVVGQGTTDLIDLAARVLLGPGEEGLTSEGSFPMYYIVVRAANAKLVRVPLRGYDYDLEAMAKAITPRTRVIYLANPNNPTGAMFTADDFAAFLERVPPDVLVVLDEAYYEYVEHANYSRSLELALRLPNLLVLRTFSKVYGLAGLRMGYGVGTVEMVEHLNKVRMPFNTSNVAQAAALAALDDYEHVRRSLESNRAGLQQLYAGLERLGVKYVPSVTNFVLVDLGSDARPTAQELLTLGVIVRPMSWMGFPNAIRVSVGTAEENVKFLAALEKVRGGVPANPKGT